MTWQSIETAPKDGTAFLAYERDGAPDYYPCWWKSEYDGDFWQNDYDNEPEPTHWMPLPERPAQS